MISTSRNKLYRFFILIISMAYIWVLYNIYYPKKIDHPILGCLLKKTTGYPCPSCGTTRATILGFQGDWKSSFMMNPLGVLVIVIMMIVPFWIAVDFILKKSTFYEFYKKTEKNIIKKPILYILIILLIINWYWNFKKNL